MKRSGSADLILHGGKAPPWLFNRMVRLGGAVMTILVDEYGTDGVLARISNTFFFQSLSNALAFDWNSSGTTTVLCGVLSEVFEKNELGVKAVGGKGMNSRKPQTALSKAVDGFNLSGDEISNLKYASKITAKVDSSAIQAGYPLYHHMLFVSAEGKWAVVQQGINENVGMARRYHWLGESVSDFTVEPHEAIVGEKIHEHVLDLTSRESCCCVKTIVDLVADSPSHLQNEFSKIQPGQKTLSSWCGQITVPEKYGVPRRMNWEVVERAHNLGIGNFEGLISAPGVGAATVRGLALVAELVYGSPASWRDPVKYSFAFGGKDGVPFPVKRREYDEATGILEDALRQSKLGDREKIEAIKRLKRVDATYPLDFNE